MNHPSWIVRTLAALTSFGYHVVRIGGIIALIGLPLVRALGPPDGRLYYGLELPVTTPTVSASVHTAWGPAPLLVDEARGKLKVPIPTAPWPFVALLWSYAAIGFALIMRFLSTLRSLLRRVRDGAPFDAENAARLRTLGLLLCALSGLRATAELITSSVVRRGLQPGGDVIVPNGFHVDGTLVVVALVLLALAEIFRRGAELEQEQSLVV